MEPLSAILECKGLFTGKISGVCFFALGAARQSWPFPNLLRLSSGDELDSVFSDFMQQRDSEL